MLLYFAPYYAISLMAVAAAGAGSYTFDAYCLFIANFWIQIVATVYVVTGTKLAWVVTSKQGSEGSGARQCPSRPSWSWPCSGVTVMLGFLYELHLVGGQ